MIRSMARQQRRTAPKEIAHLFSEVVREVRLIWRLFLDRRVSPGVKLIIPATFIYILSPIDLLPDPILGLGQLDDLTALILGAKLFLEMCPREVVEEHLKKLTSLATSPRGVGELGGGFLPAPSSPEEGRGEQEVGDLL